MLSGRNFCWQQDTQPAAGNRVQDRALVRSLSSALVNRVSILNIRVDVQEWIDWASANGVRRLGEIEPA